MIIKQILYILPSPHCVKSLNTPALQMGASLIIPNRSVCRAAYYYLKNIHYLKAFLTQEALVTVVHAFVTPRIDYCNKIMQVA